MTLPVRLLPEARFQDAFVLEILGLTYWRRLPAMGHQGEAELPCRSNFLYHCLMAAASVPPGGGRPLQAQPPDRPLRNSTDVMPPVWVYEGSDGVLEIINGATRATRIAKLAPGTKIRARSSGLFAPHQHPTADSNKEFRPPDPGPACLGRDRGVRRLVDVHPSNPCPSGRIAVWCGRPRHRLAALGHEPRAFPTRLTSSSVVLAASCRRSSGCHPRNRVSREAPTACGRRGRPRGPPCVHEAIRQRRSLLRAGRTVPVAFGSTSSGWDSPTPGLTPRRAPPPRSQTAPSSASTTRPDDRPGDPAPRPPPPASPRTSRASGSGPSS